MHTLYVSPQCPNCTRFLGAMQRIAGLKNSIRVVDVTRSGSPVEYVPTLVLQTGQQYTGTKLFEWLKEHEADAPLDGMSFADCAGLPFSELQDEAGGLATFAKTYSAFEAPN